MAVNHAVKRTGRFYDAGGAEFNVKNPKYSGGAKGDGVTNDTAAILEALDDARSDASTLSGAPAPSYVGAKIRFPKGRYLVDADALDIDDLINVRFVGAGSRLWNNYFLPMSAIIVDGTGTTSASYGLNLQGQALNMTRGVSFADLSIMYTNGFAGDLIKGDLSGFAASRCWFGADSVSSTRPLTAATLIRFWSGHHYRFTDCNFSDAIDLILIDNATGANTNDWGFRGCTFFDAFNSYVRNTGASVAGLSFDGACSFDPVNAVGQPLPVYGIDVDASGFAVNGGFFAGSTMAHAPTAAWIRMRGGAGIVHAAHFKQNNAAALAIALTAGHLDVRGNRFDSVKSIDVSGSGHLTGGNNRHVYQGSAETEVAVTINPSSASACDYGPDEFTATGAASYANSYSLGGGAAIGGVVKYSPDLDGSNNGPTFNVTRGSIRLVPMRSQKVTTGTSTLTAKETGFVFTPGATATYTLPAQPGNLEYTFVKSGAGVNITINAGAGDVIYDGSGASKTSIANTTAEVGSVLKIRSISDSGVTEWLVEVITGTWA